MVTAYSRGRRFELYLVEKFRKAGLKAERVPLSGRAHKILPDADLVVERKFKGKVKTTKAKKYVSFPKEEVADLLKGKVDFLAFNFSRTQPLFLVRFDDFIRILKRR